MNTKNKIESPLKEGVAGSVEKKYYTADEAISFMEPHIRAMFR